MKKKNIYKANRRGFTLVELIVVLVILAVLAAILIPALLGWIDKAKEKKYLLEARNVVMATQAVATSDYAAGTFENQNQDYSSRFLLNYEKEIIKIADVSSNNKIAQLDFTDKGAYKVAIIQKLEYVIDNGPTIIYDRNASPVYQISEESGAPSHDKNWPSLIDKYLAEHKLDKTTPNMREALKAIYGGSYPSLVTREKKILSKNIDGIKNLSTDKINSLQWKPVDVKGVENGMIMIANDSDVNNNVLAYMVYYNGSYYGCLNKVGNDIKYDNAPVHNNIDLSDLTSSKPIDYYTDKSDEITAKTWVKLS